MKSSSCIRRSLSLCNIMHLHVKGRFPVKWLANLILFTQPSVESATAGKWVDSWERLQFRFFLNLFSCLLITNLSRRNNTFSLSKERQQRVNPHYNPRLFTQSHCHQRCSLDRHRIQMTRFSFYDHDATQSECAHRLVWHGSTDIKATGIWLPPPPYVGNKSTTFFMQLNTFLL